MRRLSVTFLFTHQQRWTVCDRLTDFHTHVLDPSVHFPLLQELKPDSALRERLREVRQYFERKRGKVKLRDLMVLAHLLKVWGGAGMQGEEKLILEQVLRLTEVLYQHNLREIQPLLREIMRLLAGCCGAFRQLQQSILTRSIVEQAKLPLGCHCTELLDILSDYFNLSPHGSQEPAARLLLLNSIRRYLQRLETRSAAPSLLKIYDVWLEEVQLDYCKACVSASAGLMSDLHTLTLVMEALEMSGVGWDKARVYRRTLEDASDVDYEAVRGVVREVLAMYLEWLEKYVEAEGLSSNREPLPLYPVLTDILQRYSLCVLPLLSRLLLSLDRKLACVHYIPLVCGTATGKVTVAARLKDLPTYSAHILLTPHLSSAPSLPPSVKAVILTSEGEIDARLVAYCRGRKMVLAVAVDCLPPPTCVEVHVFPSTLTFM